MLIFTIHFSDFIIAGRLFGNVGHRFQRVKAQFGAVNLEKCDETVAYINLSCFLL